MYTWMCVRVNNRTSQIHAANIMGMFDIGNMERVD